MPVPSLSWLQRGACCCCCCDSFSAYPRLDGIFLVFSTVFWGLEGVGVVEVRMGGRGLVSGGGC